jgi:HlyD family secretion protein
MSSNLIRMGFAVIVATIGATAFVLAQGQPAEVVRPKGIVVFNPVEGRMVVVTSKPDGARVEKGDIVCELDSAELQDRLANQEIVIRAALAEVQSQRLAREVAVMTETEYKEVAFRQQLATIQSEVKLAETKLIRAEDSVDWARRMFQKGYVSLQEKTAGELALMQARFGLEQAQGNKNALVDHSKEKAIKALLSALESARARELGARAALDREQSLQKRLVAQIARCKVVAPVAGRIEFAAPIGAGAVVRDGDLLFRIVPDFFPKTKVD